MPPAAFSHRSDPQRTPEGTPPVFTRCGLADGLFEHPARPNSTSYLLTEAPCCVRSKKEAQARRKLKTLGKKINERCDCK